MEKGLDKEISDFEKYGDRCLKCNAKAVVNKTQLCSNCRPKCPKCGVTVTVSLTGTNVQYVSSWNFKNAKKGRKPNATFFKL